MHALGNRIWFVGLVDRKSLWFEARDWEGNLAVPRTGFESVDSQGNNPIELSQASVTGIGDNVLLLWMRRWYTLAGYYRKQICYQIRNTDGQLVKETTVLTPLFHNDIETDDGCWFHSFLTDNQGKVWIAYQHLQSGQPTKYAYVVLSRDGDILKGPVQTTAARHFGFCDRIGYIWATENGRLLVMNPNETAATVPRQPVWMPNQSVVAAPAAVVDSLRQALIDADRRTQALEASLARSQAALTRQLAAGDSARRRASAEVARLQTELERAGQAQVSPGLVDSLRQAIRDAEDQAANITAQLRAVSGVNLAAVAEANQGAVGLVTVFMGLRLFDGSGFVITPSGYFVTNRHVAQLDGEQADSVFVTMADERFRVGAEVSAVAPPGGPDLAVLRILDYSGAHVERVDWSGTRATQGEPAALIGFPAGLGAALDQTRRVRTSMSAGIFSKVTPELIQFDGFTVEGSSGSPVFNSSGEVVAVHRGSLRGATGLGFAVPIKLLVPLLPPEVKAEFGIE